VSLDLDLDLDLDNFESASSWENLALSPQSSPRGGCLLRSAGSNAVRRWNQSTAGQLLVG
jgi:hypothetical protein